MPHTLISALGGSPFDGREFRWKLGMSAIDSSDWVHPDDRRVVDLQEKHRLLTERPGDVAAWEDGSEPASQEVLELVLAQVRRSESVVDPVDGDHPLVAAGRLIQEDLCLMERRGPQWVLTAGLVCFPTRWSVGEKIGRDMAEIHRPVPGIETIEHNIDRFFDRMRPGSIVQRINWSMSTDPALRLEPQSGTEPTPAPPDIGEELLFRVERQTLRKLDSGNHICFTIRVHRWPLGEVVAELPAEALAEALRTMPDDVALYKDLAGMRSALLDWLGSQ